MKKAIPILKIRTIFAALLIVAMLAGFIGYGTGVAAANTNFTLLGYNIPTTGGFTPGWTGGNLGKSYDEGEWVPYQFTITDVQTNYPNLNNFGDLVISWDFTGGNTAGDPRFGDLIRDIQVGTTILTNTQAFPMSNGSAYPLTTLSQANAGQRDPNENTWTGFQLLHLPNTQINRPVSLSGNGTVDDAERAFVVHPSDLTSHGIPTSANTIVVYFQIHESLTFVWSNGLQSAYATNAQTAAWGGYLYGISPFDTDVRQGSGFVPGSSGHVHNLGIGGSQDVPLPIPPNPPGLIDGYKFNDLNNNHVWDQPAEPGINDWVVHVFANLNGIIFDAHYHTNASGFYSIPNITAGIWYVGEHKGPGDPVTTIWAQTFPNSVINVSPDAVSSLISNFPADVIAAIGASHLADWGYVVTLTDAAPVQHNINFGNVLFATKSGMKFNDLDADGVKDAGEPGLVGWTIYVDYDNDGVKDAGEPFAVTAADGTYSITGITPGTWRVKEVAQAGWTQSFPASGYHEENFVGGQTYTNNDFGNWTSASKSGMKFNDLDADGVKDAGEPGLVGWTIYVDYDNDGVKDAGEPFAVTAADGTYSITGISPGTWRVKEVAQAGWTQSFPAGGYYEETFTSGSSETGNDFGNWTPASKSGMKFNDLNADGVKDAGEPGLVGWTIYVDYDNDGVKDAGEPFAVTAADGTYSITGITPGTWRVKEVAQAGWTQSFPAGGYYEETFTSGSSETSNDFGNYTSASKSGMKFNDLDADGVKDAGEPGLVGWTIYVDYDNDGVKDAGEPFAVTAADGTYSITGITPGTWRVKEVAQAGWTQSFPASGYYEETFTSGSSETGNDFGNWTPASKSGMKFNDLDADGVKDAGEPGLVGWTIYVDYDNDGVKDAGEPFAVTAADGTYSITGINPGTWRVKEVAQAGWTQSFPAGGYYEETFTSGSSETGNDFGNYTSASKSGMKFNDLDADGVKDAGEPGLAGWTIYVDYDNDGIKDAGEPFAVTAADGTYSITGITPGTWRVKEVAQAGWTQSFPAGGYYEETFTSGSSETGNDFGNWTTATKSGIKFNDLNDANGVKDAGEPVLPGWTIRAYADTNGDGLLSQAEYDAGEVDSDVTDAGGAYSFTLDPGDYIVVEVLQDKDGTPYYQSAPATPVLDAGLNTGTEVLGPNGYAITLTSSQVDSNNDFANYWPHTTMQAISFVWETTADGNVTLTISDMNDGDVVLTDAHIHVLADTTAPLDGADAVDVPGSPFGAPPTSGDDGDILFEPGETWTWVVYATVNTDTLFVSWGHGEDPQGNHVDYPEYQSELDTVFVEFGEATRTQGFWATHLVFTTYVWDNYIEGNTDFDLGGGVYGIDLGYKQVTSVSELMGIFWANNARESDGSKRTKLCQARQTAANQALAAILNSVMPGGAPLPAGYSLTEIAAILGGTDINAINMLNTDLTAFNESGDDVALDPSLPPTAKADPQGAKDIADIEFADCN